MQRDEEMNFGGKFCDDNQHGSDVIFFHVCIFFMFFFVSTLDCQFPRRWASPQLRVVVLSKARGDFCLLNLSEDDVCGP